MPVHPDIPGRFTGAWWTSIATKLAMIPLLTATMFVAVLLVTSSDVRAEPRVWLVPAATSLL